MKPLKEKVSITLSSDILAEIRRLAEEDDRSVSQYIDLVLKKYLEKRKDSELPGSALRSRWSHPWGQREALLPSPESRTFSCALRPWMYKLFRSDIRCPRHGGFLPLPPLKAVEYVFPSQITSVLWRVTWQLIFTAQGIPAIWVGSVSIFSPIAVVLPPKPCGPMPSSLTFSSISFSKSA